MIEGGSVLGKDYIFKGKRYSSYYQLEKIMGIPRKTIQYRHETIGIPIDDIPDFKAKPPIERFGEKRYFPERKQNKSVEVEDELKRIIEYPDSPNFYIDSNNQDRTEERKEKYMEWLMSAPPTLIKRELRIYEGDLRGLIEEEENQYFYASTYHEDEKEKAEIAIQIIHEVIEKREIDQ